MTKVSSLLVALFLVSTGVIAGPQNDVPSCYAANNVGRPAPAIERELFVLIDQTTVLNDRLKTSVRENVAKFLGPSTAFVVADFSAFSQGRYLEVLSSGAMEGAFPEKERDSIGIRVLKNFDVCMLGQARYVQKITQDAIDKAFTGFSVGLSKSDVMASLKSLSERVKQSDAKDKVVFIVSDMLENSSVSSFYAGNNVRGIDPTKEIKLAQTAKVIGDFGGARVFVLGAGTIPENPKIPTGVYRDPKVMNALRDFWEQYMQLSNAKLQAFGAPALLTNLK